MSSDLTDLETLLLRELREATGYLASALYGHWNESRRDEAKAFLRIAHDSRESIEKWRESRKAK